MPSISITNVTVNGCTVTVSGSVSPPDIAVNVESLNSEGGATNDPANVSGSTWSIQIQLDPIAADNTDNNYEITARAEDNGQGAEDARTIQANCHDPG